MDIAHGGTGASTAKGARDKISTCGVVYDCMDLDDVPTFREAAILFANNAVPDTPCKGYPSAVTGGNQAFVLNFKLSERWGAQLAFSFSSPACAWRARISETAWGGWQTI